MKKGFTLVEVIIALAIIVLLCAIVVPSVIHSNKNFDGRLIEAGYNPKDVRIFCSSIGVYYGDFLESRLLQAQFNKAINGESTDFINKATAKQQADESKSSAFAAGVAGGVVGGAAVRR